MIRPTEVLLRRLMHGDVKYYRTSFGNGPSHDRLVTQAYARFTRLKTRNCPRPNIPWRFGEVDAPAAGVYCPVLCLGLTLEVFPDAMVDLSGYIARRFVCLSVDVFNGLRQNSSNVTFATSSGVGTVLVAAHPTLLRRRSLCR